jgi:hypothetical protein
MSGLAVVEDVAALDALDPASREVALTGILTQSRDWLVRATQATDPARAVSEFKAFISTVAEAAKQKKVSEEIVTEATVMVRRTERALGVAIREGQERGLVESTEEAKLRASYAGVKSRGIDRSVENTLVTKPRPLDYATGNDLHGNGAGIYHMTDDVTDAQFEEALTEAVQEGNVSRANLVRKIRGEISPLPSAARVTQKTANNGVLSRTANILSGLRAALSTIQDLDPGITTEEITEWTTELTTTIQELNRIRKLLKEATK